MKRRKFAGADFVAARSTRSIRRQISNRPRTCRSRPTTLRSPACPTSPRPSCFASSSPTASMCWSRSRCGRRATTTFCELRAHRARQTMSVCYTAYNHRFEPHFVRMRDLIASGELGELYSCRMFYGNGTARSGARFGLARSRRRRAARSRLAPARYLPLLVRRSSRTPSISRPPIGSRTGRRIMRSSISEDSWPRFNLEMTLLMWRNHFTCDILAENGSAHIASLCKWGPSTFTRRAPRPAVRPPARRSHHRAGGRSDLGARIRTFPRALRTSAYRPIWGTISGCSARCGALRRMR